MKGNVQLLMALWLGLAPWSVHGVPPRKLVDQGNRAFAAGNYQQALQAYDEAAVALPESAEIAFNRGAAHYELGGLTEAKEAFQDASVRAKEPALVSLAKYNLGNLAFREAERQQDSDLKKSIEACERAIASYQESLRLNPEYRQAAENLEMVRLSLKALLDEQARRDEQDQQENELAKKLKELIQRQQGAIQSSLAAEREQDEELRRDHGASLAVQQAAIQDDTVVVRGEVEGMAGGGAPGSESLVRAGEHLRNAEGHQEEAMSILRATDLTKGRSEQEFALEALVEALQELSQPQQDQQEQGEQGDQEQQTGEQGDSEETEGSSSEDEQEGQDGKESEEGQEEGTEDQEAAGEQAGEEGEEGGESEQGGMEEAEEGAEEGGESQEVMLNDELAREILQEELERRKGQEGRALRGGRPVEKDW
ncbi:MAG: hypothetical protein AAF191_03865 [Verrucomicrobiota bacterium]